MLYQCRLFLIGLTSSCRSMFEEVGMNVASYFHYDHIDSWFAFFKCLCQCVFHITFSDHQLTILHDYTTSALPGTSHNIVNNTHRKITR